MNNVSPETQRKLIPLKDAIVEHFDEHNWLELGALTSCLDIVNGHDRLLRSLYWRDPDYPGAALTVLIGIVRRDEGNVRVIEHYLQEKVGDGGEVVSSTMIAGRKIVFAPSVFEVPDAAPDPTLVSVMMPFAAEFDATYQAIVGACVATGLTCQRADNMWEHATVIQDIFSLIFRSFIVVCDFTGRNPNVFYEAGIAHTLGKHVVPITQSQHDVPFDLQHHRYIRYLNNGEGLVTLQATLAKRLRTLTGSARIESAPIETAPAGLTPPEFIAGLRVHHRKFGQGVVTEVDGKKITVDFEGFGHKRIVDSFLSLVTSS